jgi:excisionase family DNA binding protein
MRSLNTPFSASVADTVRWSGISRSRLYELIASGEIEARKAGTKTLIVTDSVVRWINSLPTARGNSVRPAAKGSR